MSLMPSCLAVNQVHIWYRLTEMLGPSAMAGAHTLLSAEEKQRHDQFRQPSDRRDYAVAHALLRSSLSRYVDVPADAWSFRLDSAGKPEPSAWAASRTSLRFNLSHTRGIVACAITAGRSVGIDVVSMEADFDYAAVASRCLSPDELVHLNALPDKDRPARFMELWALKEAFTKATGRGLSDEISTFGFLLRRNAIRFIAPGYLNEKMWQFGLFIVKPHYRIAVAIECPNYKPFTFNVRSADGSPEPEAAAW